MKDRKIASLEEIYIHSLPIKEYQIIDFFYEGKDASGEEFNGGLKDEVMKIMPVQKQTRAGQRTRFKAFVIVGDGDGHVGLGVKCAKEVATAIRGAIIAAKLSLIPVRWVQPSSSCSVDQQFTAVAAQLISRFNSTQLLS